MIPALTCRDPLGRADVRAPTDLALDTHYVLAIETYLDPESERRVRSIWAAIDARGGGSLGSVPGTEYRPHVSLAVFADADLALLSSALRPILAPCLGMSVTLASVGFFVSPELVAFLGVTPTHQLLDAHRNVHTALDGLVADSWSLYGPGAFVPHCTLAMGVDDVAQVLDAVNTERLPIHALVHEVHIVEISSGRTRARLT